MSSTQRSDSTARVQATRHVNTPTNLRALMDGVDRLSVSERYPSAMHASLAHDDGSKASGWWATEGGYMQGTIEAPDGSRFHGTAHESHGLEGALTMNGGGCSWVFASQAVRSWIDSAALAQVGQPPIKPRGVLGARVVRVDGRWDRCGAGDGVIVYADGRQQPARWTHWLTVVA